MALTRPKASQINTVITNVSDPIIVLNNNSTVANIDIGLVLNRGSAANVAMVWQESSGQFVLATTSSSGLTNANVTISSYANLRAGNVSATTATITNLIGDANITVTGSLLPSANITYDLGSPTQRWRSGWFAGSTIHIGSESISVDTNGKWMFTSDGATVELGKNNDFNPPSANVSGAVTAGSINVTGHLSQGTGTYVARQYVLHGTTTNATETEIFTVGDGARMPVNTNTTVMYDIHIVARRTDATGESAAWQLQGCADNFSGSVADVGDIYEVVVAQDDITWAVDARADDTNNSINLYVTGAANKTIRWTAVVKTIEVAQ